MSAYRVGLTGGLACGKSTVAEQLAAHGAYVCDADTIVGELTAAGGAALPLLQQAVGDWVVAADGSYDRAAVRERIFADSDAGSALRRQIEAVLHPLVRQETKKRLEEATAPYGVAVIPLLFESDGWAGYFRRVVVVDCAREVQVARANARDKKQDAARIIAAQMDAAERRRRADEVLENNGDLPLLQSAVRALHERLLAAAAE